MQKILSIIFTVGILVSSTAQIGINKEEMSENVLLHISEKLNENEPVIPKGIIIPRLSESERDILTYENPLANPKVLKLLANDNSLMIYNTTEECYNYWNYIEEEWKSLCGKLGKAIFTINCPADLSVFGTYIESKEVTNSNYLSFKVNVTKPGDYSIIVATDNGYSFTASGTFLDTGNYTVQALAQGTPINIGLDDLTINANGIDINCDPVKQIEVLSSAGTYTINCKSIKVNGVYKQGIALNSGNSITVPVYVENLGSWEMKTDISNGISFTGSGTFTSIGQQEVTLYGFGRPTTLETITLDLTHFSEGIETSNCDFIVRIVIPQKRILGIGLDQTYGYNITNNKPSRFLLDTPTNFGELPESIVPFEGFVYVDGGNYPSDTFLRNNLLGENGNPIVDIVVIGYSYNPTVYQADLFLEYLIKRGVLIMHTEGRIGNERMMQAIFNIPNLSQTSVSGDDGQTYDLPLFDDPILNGPFGDIRGKQWGDDATFAVYFTNLPNGEIIQYSNSQNSNTGNGYIENSVTSFRHRTFNWLWIGEGGFTSQSEDAAAIPSNIICPFILDQNKFPIPKTTYAKPVYNSIFFANTMAWAIQQAEFNGINTN